MWARTGARLTAALNRDKSRSGLIIPKTLTLDFRQVCLSQVKNNIVLYGWFTTSYFIVFSNCSVFRAERCDDKNNRRIVGLWYCDLVVFQMKESFYAQIHFSRHFCSNLFIIVKQVVHMTWPRIIQWVLYHLKRDDFKHFANVSYMALWMISTVTIFSGWCEICQN